MEECASSVHHDQVHITAVLGSLLLCACALAANRLDDEGLIRELDEAWSRALERKDLEAVMANYGDDAVFLPPHAPILEGKAKIREFFAARMATPGYSATFQPTRVVVAKSGEMAWEIGTFRATGADGTERRGKHLVTWAKRDGVWKVVAECINHDA